MAGPYEVELEENNEDAAHADLISRHNENTLQPWQELPEEFRPLLGVNQAQPNDIVIADNALLLCYEVTHSQVFACGMCENRLEFSGRHMIQISGGAHLQRPALDCGFCALETS